MPKYPTIIDRSDGTVIGANLQRINEMPFQLMTNQPRNLVQIPSGQAVQQIPMSVSGQGPAVIHEFACERELSTGTPLVPGYANATDIATVLLQIQDGQSIRALMNGAAHIDTIFGNYLAGNKPYPLAEALYVDEQRKILFSATDLSNPGGVVTNNIRPMFNCQRLLTRIFDADASRAKAKMERRQYLTMPFFYVLDNSFSVLPAWPGGGAPFPFNTETITIGGDSHFEMFQLSAVATAGLGSFDISIVEQSTGESVIDAPQATNLPMSSGLVCGSASFPVRLHEPRFFEIGSKLIVTLVNRSLAPNTVYLTLGGRALADRMWS